MPLTSEEIDKLINDFLQDQITAEELEAKLPDEMFEYDPMQSKWVEKEEKEEVKKNSCAHSNPECKIVKSHALGNAFLYCRTHDEEVF